MNENDKLISIKEASFLLGVHKRTLMNWDKNKKLVSIRTVGGHRRYKLSHIKNLIDNGFKNEKY